MSSTFRLALLGLLIVGMTASAHAQGRGRGRGFGGGGFGGFGGGPTSLVDLAMQEDVQKECEIVSDQVGDIEKIQEDTQEAMRNSREELQDVPRDQLFTKLREMFAEANQDAEKKLGRVLLPHQTKRLKQIQFQSRTRGSVARALAQEDIADMLDVTPDQQAKIQEVAEKAEEELQKEVAKLRQAASEKVLAVLNSDQQKKWKDLAGEPFEFQNRGFGGGRGNFNRGGRGRGGQPGAQGRAGRGRGRGNNNNN